MLSSTVPGNETDHMALLSFKAGLTTQDQLQVMASWHKSTHFCNWTGVVCGRKHQRVISIRLSSQGLTGPLSPDIGNLSFLRELFLYDNGFTGNIPQEIGKLSRLSSLALGNNSFSGEIPANISQCLNLVELDLGGNNLVGIILMEFQAVLKLQRLYVDSNNLTGHIPAFLGKFSDLGYIYGLRNNFQGSVPDTLGRLTKLTEIGFAGNKLSGTLPPSIFNSSSLVLIDFPDNQIEGSLPLDIGLSLPRIEGLNLAGNQFIGNIPVSISNASQLVRLALNRNGFTGGVPNFNKLQNLQWLALSGNQLGNGATDDLSFFPSLINCTNLQLLQLADNNFGGVLPKSIGNLSELNWKSSKAEAVVALWKQIVWEHSFFIRKLNLIDQPLSRSLSGYIPKEVFSLSSLSISLDLSSNRLTGSLLLGAGDFQNLASLNLSNNMLSGEFPSSPGSCTSLTVLSVAGNLFQGGIPQSLSSLRSIEVLDLSRNNLTGEIPEYMQNFQFLLNLNLSFNDFEVEVPVEGAFQNVSKVLLDGNSKLCGGVPELKLPKCATRNASNRNKFTVSKVSYQSLYRATDGFSSANLIGSGKFSSVYKGILEETVVAVKVLNLEVHGAIKSFMAECEALKSIRHRNLVKILTSCSSIDFQGRDFKAIVYAYMVSGSLDEWLHHDPIVGGGNEERRSLSLLQRLNIAIDVACALDYLHNNCGTTLVHCDLKPSNVLLDINLVAHLGDFGLARFLPQTTNAYSTSQSNSMAIKGTIGYAAPEYGMGAALSTYGDVYSYGILLLEIFTGKRPTDDMFSNGLNLHKFAEMAIPSRVTEVCDPVLLYDEEQDHPELLQDEEQDETRRKNLAATGNQANPEKLKDTLVAIFTIGIACSKQLPRERMDIVDVTNRLHSIRDTLPGSIGRKVTGRLEVI
ncbi:hypothetical protein RJ640_000781 [Escallonia rubra]|uniref:non-specific serine/threonine protein kinase n=1 Tax=Escallonia rubra TaxID=112253 RepID=A0AA88S3L3_9ASTE|nr:hypothetical protein RJ640_000781 [Escallonia rubra]